MPKRSNDFQRLVFLIQHQVEDRPGTTVTESKMLQDRAGGEPREVDIVVEFTQNGVPFILSFECRDTKRKVTIEAAEQLVQKHRNLSDKLVIVSKAGFSKSAEQFALANRAEIIKMGAAGGVDWSAYIERYSQLMLGIFDFSLVSHEIDYTPLTENAGKITELESVTVIDPPPTMPLQGFLLQQLRRPEVGKIVMDRWFESTERKKEFNANIAFCPPDGVQFVISWNGHRYSISAVRMVAKGTASTASFALAPLMFAKTPVLHGAPHFSEGAYKSQSPYIVIQPTLDSGDKVSVYFPPKAGESGPEVRHGTIEKRKQQQT
jgi:hypothetical protein